MHFESLFKLTWIMFETILFPVNYRVMQIFQGVIATVDGILNIHTLLRCTIGLFLLLCV
jgi:hypothetical protein